MVSAAELRAELKRLKRETESGKSAAHPASASPQKTSRRSKLWMAMAGAVAFIAVIAVVSGNLLRPSANPIDSIAVLPFANVGGSSDTDYLSDGLTESLIDSLAHVPQLTGRVTQRGDTIQVSAELTKVGDNTQVWGEQYTHKSTDLISLQQQIAGDIAEKLRSKLSGTEKQQVTKESTQNPEAYELYLKGRYY